LVTVRAARSSKSLPTSTDPVKLIWRTWGAVVSASPITTGSPHTRFTTPGGKPASSKISNSAVAEMGVCSAGLRTTVLPAAVAGAIFRRIMLLGKFQGVMQTTTPRGRPRT
jgi:hypothetical protein